MRLAIFLILIAYPLLELAVLIRVGQAIGVVPTIAIVIGTALLGLLTLRRQGFAMASQARQTLASGFPAVFSVAEGSLVFFASLLLILPGLIGDVIGLLLLIPPIRRVIATWSLGRFAQEGAAKVKVYTFGGRSDGARPADRRQPQRQKPGPIIEGDYKRIDEPHEDRRDKSD